MNNYEKKVLEFHKAFELPYNETFSAELLANRKAFLNEEIKEFYVEIDEAIVRLEKGEKIDRDLYLCLVKEMSDVQYTLSGFAVSFGIDAEKVFDLVHASNMSKLDNNRKPIKRPNGKIVKSENYKDPDFSELEAKI